MNKILIVDASESDRRLMSGLLTRAGYEPIAVDKMEAAKDEVAKLPPGAVVVAAIDKQLVETVGRYAKPENAVLVLDDSLIPAGATLSDASKKR